MVVAVANIGDILRFDVLADGRNRSGLRVAR